MNFVEKVKERIGPVIDKYDLKILEESTDFLKIASQGLLMGIAHNPLEKSYTLWFCKNDGSIDSVEINDKLLKEFFHSDLKLNDIPLEPFLDNLVLFFENEARGMLSGKLTEIDGLMDFSLKQAGEYTQELLNRQNLNGADQAWKNKDYKTFIQFIDKIKGDTLPPSYLLKYKMARQRL